VYGDHDEEALIVREGHNLIRGFKTERRTAAAATHDRLGHSLGPYRCSPSYCSNTLDMIYFACLYIDGDEVELPNVPHTP
jgi:hypothetical protein